MPVYWMMFAIPALALLEDHELRRRCRQAAQEWFSLEMGVARYDAMYRKLAGVRNAASCV